MRLLAALAGRRRGLIIAVWVVVVAVAVPFALRQSDRLTGRGFAVPGSQSARAEHILAAGVPVDLRPTGLTAVLVGSRASPRSDYQAALSALAAVVHRTPGVTLPRVSAEVGLYLATHRRGRPALVPLDVTVDEFNSADVAKTLRARLGVADGRRYGSVRLHLVGAGALWAGLLDVSKSDLTAAERIGLPLVVLILLVIFGSLSAALLPVALGAVAVTVTGALIWWLSGVTSMNFYVTNMASMIGLGVAVDYSLFIVVRYREELRAGASADAARATAMATSGIAVLTSGAAVIASLAALFLVNTAAIQSLAVGAIAVVAVSMLACATLVPALLDFAGRTRTRRERASLAFTRWAAFVLRHPRGTLVAALTILVTLTLPALSLRSGDGALRELPKGSEARAGFDAARTVEPVGRGTPLKVLVSHRDLSRTVRLLLSDPEVAHTSLRTQTRDHRFVFLAATPRHVGDSDQAKALVRRLRSELPPGSIVGGDSAEQVDFDAAVTGSLWKIVVWIVAVMLLILLLFVRSLPLALEAVVADLLSVAAAFGVLTAVFVKGWFDQPLGLHSPGYIDTLAIPLVLAVVFGLSMDYEVFLLGRIRERYLATGRTSDAVQEGLASSARTITGAALIMVAVFAAFAVTGVPAVQEVGLGAAVAIAVDATIVRLGLVPALIALLGERSWWLPRLRRLRVRESVR
jgi:RND superfamily putative drug exporter